MAKPPTKSDSQGTHELVIHHILATAVFRAAMGTFVRDVHLTTPPERYVTLLFVWLCGRMTVDLA